MAIHVVLEGLSAKTHGLANIGLRELEVSVDDSSLLPGAKQFLSNMGEALEQGTIHLYPGETVQCGYWLVKFDEAEPGLLRASEPDADNTQFIPGATLALRYWKEQQEMCRGQRVEFDPPHPLSLIACSDGVLTGRSPIGGTRYRHHDKMTGWFLSTDLYDGTNESVSLHHAHHVTAARPELARYLALPPGFRFDHGPEVRVWHDPEVAGEEPW